MSINTRSSKNGPRKSIIKVNVRSKLQKILDETNPISHTDVISRLCISVDSLTEENEQLKLELITANKNLEDLEKNFQTLDAEFKAHKALIKQLWGSKFSNTTPPIRTAVSTETTACRSCDYTCICDPSRDT